MENYSEKKVIKLSMIVLFLSLMIIYVLFYHMKGKSLSINTETATSNIQKTINQTNSQPELIAINKTWNTEITENNTPNNTGDQFSAEFYERYENQIQSWTNNPNEIQIIEIETPEKENSDENHNNEENHNWIQTNNIINLSWTNFYHGPIESIEKLWISYPYALKDEKDIYYINLGENNYDFAELVRQLNGYLYVINTEQELLKNNLFGNKVTYINIPEYKDKIVIMLIELNNQKRLIQVSYTIYHESKEHIKSVFSQN